MKASFGYICIAHVGISSLHMAAWHLGAHCKAHLNCLLETALGTTHMFKLLPKWIAESDFNSIFMLKDVDEYRQTF